jgi:pimeloyl-ACP methyl ester carboxylesterase
MPSRALAVLAVLAAVAAAGCGSDDAATDRDTSTVTDTASEDDTGSDDDTGADGDRFDRCDPPGTATGALRWDTCGDELDRGTLTVPLDHDDPSRGTIELAVVRRPADDPSRRIGTLLVNPGGPGFGGTMLAELAESIYSDALLERFDIVGWDPRGTGGSDPAVDCIDDYDPYFAVGDITPDTAAERAELVDAARSFAEACAQRSGQLLPYVSTNASARDMDLLRQALGEDQISYFGFSYGSELGATWATLFPATVRAAVLDGAADPDADPTEGLIQQLAGFEATLATFLADCSANPDCAFHSDGDAEGAFDALMAELDEDPVPTEADRPDLTRGMALTAVAQAMYDQSLWPILARGLDDARQGDGSTLLALFDAYYQRRPDGTYGNELEAFLAITCADTDERPTLAKADAEVPRYQDVAPRFAPGTTGDYSCTFWPTAGDPRIRITGAGAGPIVVIGTTGDPATPLDSTRRMADALADGRLVVVHADQHTGYGVNDCVDQAVDAYLVDLVAPPDELDCP